MTFPCVSFQRAGLKCMKSSVLIYAEKKHECNKWDIVKKMWSEGCNVLCAKRAIFRIEMCVCKSEYMFDHSLTHTQARTS